MTGTLGGDCGLPVAFQGALNGNSLTGTVIGGRFSAGSTASGTISGANLSITVTDPKQEFLGGELRLHR